MRSSASFKSFPSSNGRCMENLLRCVIPVHSKSFPNKGLPKTPCPSCIRIRELDPMRRLWNLHWYQPASLNAVTTSAYGIHFSARNLRASTLHSSSLTIIAVRFPGGFTTCSTRNIHGLSPSTTEYGDLDVGRERFPFGGRRARELRDR